MQARLRRPVARTGFHSRSQMGLEGSLTLDLLFSWASKVLPCGHHMYSGPCRCDCCGAMSHAPHRKESSVALGSPQGVPREPLRTHRTACGAGWAPSAHHRALMLSREDSTSQGSEAEGAALPRRTCGPSAPSCQCPGIRGCLWELLKTGKEMRLLQGQSPCLGASCILHSPHGAFVP